MLVVRPASVDRREEAGVMTMRRGSRIQQRHLAVGVVRQDTRIVSLAIPEDMYLYLHTKAISDRTSISEEIRMHIEWGIESAEATQ